MNILDMISSTQNSLWTLQGSRIRAISGYNQNLDSSDAGTLLWVIGGMVGLFVALKTYMTIRKQKEEEKRRQRKRAQRKSK